jgi:hypothetical protein
MMIRKVWIAMCFLAPFSASAQEVAPKPQPPQVPMVIEPADADIFRDIIESTIPPRYNGALIRWYTAILQRQQAKQAELAKAAQPQTEEPKQ